jgi:hypothetical protein
MRSGLENIIKLEIEHIFGRRIVSSRDCIQLSDEIYRKTEFQLNPNTLRRFFGLVKTDYPASLSTLNILSNYCGFGSIEDVHSFKKEKSSETDFVQQKGVLNYLVSLFTEIPVAENNEETFTGLVLLTIKFLNKNSGLREKFQSIMVKTENGQKYFYEHFVHIDMLNSFYGNSLRYYLNEKRTYDACVFGNSLFVFRYWLTIEDEKLEKHFQLINWKPGQFLAPYIYARYFSALLFQAHSSKQPTEKVIIDIFKYYSFCKSQKGNDKSMLAFKLVAGEALILTGHFKEGLYYFDLALKMYTSWYNNPEMLQTIYLFQTIALYKLNEWEKAEVKFDLIKTFEFCFLSKKYMTVLYLFLSIEIKRKISKYDEQLTALIDELGFIRMKEILKMAQSPI